MNGKSTHLGDFELLELVDRRGAPAERAAWLDHARDCAECARAVDELRQTSALVSGAVARIQLPSEFALEPPAGLPADTADVIPLRRPSTGPARVPGWLRVAAVLALLLVPLVAVQPVRAAVGGWLADRWARVAALFAEQDRATAVTADDGSTVYFDATAPELEIRFDAPQPAGTLTLAATAGEQISFEITDRAGDEAPVVGDGGLRVRNTDGSVASYAVELPAAVERVHVRVGDGPVSTFRVGDAGWRRVVPLR